MHQLTPAQNRAYCQTRRAPFFGVNIGLGDSNALVHGQIGFGNDQSSHQFGQGCNGQDGVVIFTVKHLMGLLIHHQGDTRVQTQRVRCGMQTRHLTKRSPDRPSSTLRLPCALIPRCLGTCGLTSRRSLSCLLFPG